MKQKEFDIFTQSALNGNKIWYRAIYTLINIIILDRNVINLLNLHSEVLSGYSEIVNMNEKFIK